jgi:hypothetical protein
VLRDSVVFKRNNIVAAFEANAFVDALSCMLSW